MDPEPPIPTPAPAPAAVTPAAEAPTVIGRRRRLAPLQWLGVALIAAAVVAAVVMTSRPEHEPWLGVVAAIAAAGGAWVLARPWSGWLILPLALAGALAAAIGFAYALPWAAWPGLGVMVGSAVRWGYAHRKRAWWFTGAVLLLLYLVGVGGVLLRCVEGRGLEWVFVQGLGSLAVGGGLALASRRLPPEWAVAASVAARVLVVAGVALPYAALTVMALGRAA